jgi:hypothetical protein
MADGPAFRSYESIDPSAPEGDTLNLAWTRDERECLSVDLAKLIEEELPAVDRYLVRDPYGEATLGLALPGRTVTCGAGVVSLLHALARLSTAVRIIGDTYPDFPYWVTQNGGTCAAFASLWFLERPSLHGDAFADVADLGALCEDAARAGAIVIVDESNANYYPPAWSAIGLAQENLVVLRGFSKAYGLGGLRLAFCVASAALTERVRSVVPPLLASSLSLRVGARVLALGDITAPLRARIAAHKREAIELFERAGVETLPPSEHLPYVLSPAGYESLEARGILGKRHPLWSEGKLADIYRLSVPLSDARIARLRQLLG